MNSTSKRSKRFHKTLNPQLNPNIGNTRFKYTRVLAVVGESKRGDAPQGHALPHFKLWLLLSALPHTGPLPQAGEGNNYPAARRTIANILERLT
jgi:hypothetical protein